MNFDVRNIRLSDRTLKAIQKVLQGIDVFIILFSLFGFFTVLYDAGFERDIISKIKLQAFYSFCLLTFFIAFFIKILLQVNKDFKSSRRISEFILFFLLLLMVVVRFTPIEYYINFSLLSLLNGHFFINLVFLTIFLIEISKQSLDVFKFNANPSILFVASFLLLILTGTGLLLLPHATVDGISIIDAFFTATSAVCVTGLIVVDTATYFTDFGKTIIMILFQVGGLGFMTFSSFFGFFFKGSSSLQTQLFLKDYINEDKIGEISKTLARIIVFTFVVELLGAVLIFFSLDSFLINNTSQKIRFAVFHSISAFCNAGFSTLSNGLYEEGMRDNYDVHLIIAGIIVIGGIGFPVIINFYNYFKSLFVRASRHFIEREEYRHSVRVFSTNPKLVVSTTVALLLTGCITFYAFEFDDKQS